MSYRWFSRYVIAAMLVDENKRFLISFFCSSTSICTLKHCYLCPWRLVANHLYLEEKFVVKFSCGSVRNQLNCKTCFLFESISIIRAFSCPSFLKTLNGINNNISYLWARTKLWKDDLYKSAREIVPPAMHLFKTNWTKKKVPYSTQ